MSDHDDPAAEEARLEAARLEVARLEVALTRIARLSATHHRTSTAPEAAPSGEVAVRLDALIAQLRKLLPKFDA